MTVVCSPVELIPEFVRRVAASCPAAGRDHRRRQHQGHDRRQVAATAVAGQAPFVGSHPLAGSEKTGVAHARDDLLSGERS